MDYKDFLLAKRIVVEPSGFEPEHEISPVLFDFQRDIVSWSLKKGKSAIFAGTGLGKTLMQLEWAAHVSEYSKGNVLILAPLAVAEQTVRNRINIYTISTYIQLGDIL
jgi:ERCC4-related helicase